MSSKEGTHDRSSTTGMTVMVVSYAFVYFATASNHAAQLRVAAGERPFAGPALKRPVHLQLARRRGGCRSLLPNQRCKDGGICRVGHSYS